NREQALVAVAPLGEILAQLEAVRRNGTLGEVHDAPVGECAKIAGRILRRLLVRVDQEDAAAQGLPDRFGEKDARRALEARDVNAVSCFEFVGVGTAGSIYRAARAGFGKGKRRP